MIENAFYIGGNTDGVHDTVFGRVGTAVCWELIRTQTVQRLDGKIDFAMTGTHWWTVASNWNVFRSYLESSDADFRELFRSTPATFSRLLGVANIHASHCGKLAGKYPMLPNRLWDVPYETQLLGETQIVDNQGKVLARMTADEGSGVLTAELDLVPSEPSLQTPDRFWIPDLQGLAKFVWWHQNSVSKGIYRRAKADQRF
jgi:predicted amidohydrolase